MDVSTLVFGTALTVLPLIVAGLLAAMVLLERSEELSARGPAQGRARGCRTRSTGGRRHRT